MALSGKINSQGIVASAAYAYIDDIRGIKNDWQAHVCLHSMPPIRDNEGRVVDRFMLLQDFTISFAPEAGTDIYTTAYAAAKQDARLAGFDDIL